MKKERLTSQRKIILDYLKSVDTHPTTEEVYHAVKKKLPQISLGTVYRNLKKLRDSGKILELHGGFCGTAHYDGNINPHAHFICEECGKIFDIKKELKEVDKNVEVGKVKNYQIYLYGVCKKCSEK
jgi:Fe2+ or Zn2+ uptake regulation protein